MRSLTDIEVENDPLCISWRLDSSCPYLMSISMFAAPYPWNGKCGNAMVPLPLPAQPPRTPQPLLRFPHLFTQLNLDLRCFKKSTKKKNGSSQGLCGCGSPFNLFCLTWSPHDLQRVEWFNTGHLIHLRLPIWAPQIMKHPCGRYSSCTPLWFPNTSLDHGSRLFWHLCNFRGLQIDTVSKLPLLMSTILG